MYCTASSPLPEIYTAPQEHTSPQKIEAIYALKTSTAQFGKFFRAQKPMGLGGGKDRTKKNSFLPAMLMLTLRPQLKAAMAATYDSFSGSTTGRNRAITVMVNAEHTIALYHDDGHFNAVNTPQKLLMANAYCPSCEITYGRALTHGIHCKIRCKNCCTMDDFRQSASLMFVSMWTVLSVLRFS